MFFAHVQLYSFRGLFFSALPLVVSVLSLAMEDFIPDFTRDKNWASLYTKAFHSNALREGFCFSFFQLGALSKLLENASKTACRSWKFVHSRWLIKWLQVLITIPRLEEYDSKQCSFGSYISLRLWTYWVWQNILCWVWFKGSDTFCAAYILTLLLLYNFNYYTLRV